MIKVIKNDCDKSPASNASKLEDNADAIPKNNAIMCLKNKNRIINQLQH